MKKIVLMIALLFGAICSYGQVAIEKPKFYDNMYFGASGGVAGALNGFFPVNASASVRLGKWITPALGVNIEDNVIFGSSMGDGMRYTYQTTIRANNLGLNFDVDILQAIHYKPERAFVVIPEVGLGWIHGYNSGFDGINDLSAKTAVMVGWNLGKFKSWQFYVEPEVLWGLTSPIQFNANRAWAGVQVGFNYAFKCSNGTHHFKTHNVGTLYSEIDYLNEEINCLRDSLAQKPTEVEVEVIKEVPVSVPREYDNHIAVFFAKNSSELVDTDQLDTLPEGVTVSIQGFASPEGNAEYNEKLSLKRAEVVAEYLQGRNITVDNTEGLGVIGKHSNRVVVVTVGEAAENAPETSVVENSETSETSVVEKTPSETTSEN